jgi:hypothetical protein
LQEDLRSEVERTNRRLTDLAKQGEASRKGSIATEGTLEEIQSAVRKLQACVQNQGVSSASTTSSSYTGQNSVLSDRNLASRSEPVRERSSVESSRRKASIPIFNLVGFGLGQWLEQHIGRAIATNQPQNNLNLTAWFSDMDGSSSSGARTRRARESEQTEKWGNGGPRASSSRLTINSYTVGASTNSEDESAGNDKHRDAADSRLMALKAMEAWNKTLETLTSALY